MYQKRRRREAFTLLELMIVLVILVMLFAMVGPRLLGSQKKADIKAATTQIGNPGVGLGIFTRWKCARSLPPKTASRP